MPLQAQLQHPHTSTHPPDADGQQQVGGRGPHALGHASWHLCRRHRQLVVHHVPEQAGTAGTAARHRGTAGAAAGERRGGAAFLGGAALRVLRVLRLAGRVVVGAGVSGDRRAAVQCSIQPQAAPTRGPPTPVCNTPQPLPTSLADRSVSLLSSTPTQCWYMSVKSAGGRAAQGGRGWRRRRKGDGWVISPRSAGA